MMQQQLAATVTYHKRHMIMQCNVSMCQDLPVSPAAELPSGTGRPGPVVCA
jgi:hypothetical protein